jgi:hypothetical protein
LTTAPAACPNSAENVLVLDLKLLHAVNHRLDGLCSGIVKPHDFVLIVDAVQQVGILYFPRSVGDERVAFRTAL